MNAKNDQSYKSLQLLDEISKEESLSQRDLSRRLNIAVGLVNSYLKNMVAKGYVRVKSFPRNRYKYLLTPKGIVEKSRLTYKHLSYFTNLYTTARKDFRALFDVLEKEGVQQVVFCGIDEVAEIAYLSLQETRIELVGVVDSSKDPSIFFGHKLDNVEEIESIDFEKIIITSFKRHNDLVCTLQRLGVDKARICLIKNAIQRS